MSLDWVTPVITAVQSIVTVVTQPPFSYFIGLALLTGVIATIKTIIKR